MDRPADFGGAQQYVLEHGGGEAVSAFDVARGKSKVREDGVGRNVDRKCRLSLSCNRQQFSRAAESQSVSTPTYRRRLAVRFPPSSRSTAREAACLAWSAMPVC